MFVSFILEYEQALNHLLITKYLLPRYLESVSVLGGYSLSLLSV